MSRGEGSEHLSTRSIVLTLFPDCPPVANDHHSFRPSPALIFPCACEAAWSEFAILKNILYTLLCGDSTLWFFTSFLIP
jgi:hypothetical protein